jgi:hypothetical protein
MTFSTGVYEHPQFELLHILSELYKGSEGPEKTIKGEGVNESQSKFLERTRLIS